MGGPEFWISLLSVTLLYSTLAQGRIFCFRRLKRRGRCGGVIRHYRYTDAAQCCSRRGQGFAELKTKLGRNRFRCTPCSKLLSDPLTSSTAPANRKRKISRRKIRHETPHRTRSVMKTTTTTTTTAATFAPTSSHTTAKFAWPTPQRRDYDYTRPDGSDVIVWQAWSPCSVSCGAGWRSRAKVCDGCDHNDYENVQSQPCMDRLYCPVDGTWGAWQPWGVCSTTCNTGVRTRARKCNYPPPAYGGAYCDGDATATKPCNVSTCPVDGQWSEWSPPSACSTTCGPGHVIRTRTCDSPIPAHGGRDCGGADRDEQPCQVRECPVDGDWSEWSVWATCSVTCGLGVREQVRSCDNPAPKHGGKICQGPERTHQECHAESPCPVDGGWSAWANYGNCRARRCSEGTQVRVRSCTSPRPAYGGRPCRGKQYSRVRCRKDDDRCPQNGSWCKWSDWNTCTASCDDGDKTPIRARHRLCACPEPKHKGQECQGDSLQVKQCENVPPCFNSGRESKVDESKELRDVVLSSTVFPSTTTNTVVKKIAQSTSYGMVEDQTSPSLEIQTDATGPK